MSHGSVSLAIVIKLYICIYRSITASIGLFAVSRRSIPVDVVLAFPTFPFPTVT